MADSDQEYDPNVGVPDWVNIVVPILMGILFVLVLVFLYFTKMEMKAETVEAWIDKVPFIGKSNNDSPSEAVSTRPQVYKISRTESPNERLRLARSNRGYQGDTGSIRSYGSGSYFYGSQATMISFESNV